MHHVLENYRKVKDTEAEEVGQMYVTAVIQESMSNMNVRKKGMPSKKL
jgi:hypothetical protein